MRYRTPMDRWARELIARMPGGRVTLKTDISQFYPSIYTHAVDWSIRGKARAKKDVRGRGLGPDLDKLLRNSRGGQTIGLSVGPDTSWLVAEVVLANIDAALAKKFPAAVRRMARFGDDLTVYASSLGEADEILAAYQVLLLEYELAINPVKASIVDDLLPVEATWVRKLRAHGYRDDRDYNLTADVIDLFDVAFEERSRHPTNGVLSYAIKRCNPFPAGVDSWPVYRDLVLASIGVEPSTLPHAHAVLEFAYRHGLLVDKTRITEILNKSLADHAKLEHGFETSWILYMIRSLSLELDSGSARVVSAMSDNCSLILLRDICEKSVRLRREVSFDAAVTRAERSDALSSSDWLLAYEYRHNRWCRPKNWDRHASWKELHRAGVRFYLKTSKPPRKVLRRRRPSFVASWLYGP
ncbi:Reverse transcriptase (RNA-dependent DNA polymerase) [Mycobacterium marinum]|nr:Reverse transcriptase (RNA-dependent DNA polymerase) [Mycobacterium marinum]RFZ12188.1 Reverse transcriptase (RNA-dependent DNA polymerase) [Mycobacterium marinum]RFZ17784.1 Reverse transcriptase (RNA-dependent DNA polymerase) [Mycobacterium marinum]RFZ23889.1 Reverse transcriptase (RNA-dependent DNA polymerase) [Mycobacterium marinum]RFZ27884.1 Reverse transcriptase (RNA-dependent DNA polymerase) [Mycobacterium marinum]